MTDSERLDKVRGFLRWPKVARKYLRFRVEQGIVSFVYLEVGDRTTTR